MSDTRVPNDPVAPAILPSYRQPHRLLDLRGPTPVLFVLLALGMGAIWSVDFPIFVAPLLLPVLILVGLVIWLLPEVQGAPIRAMTVLLFAFMIGLLVWPDYLALSFPGMPWITVIRLTGLPLMFVTIVTLSISPLARQRLVDVLSVGKPVWISLVVISVITLVTVPVAHRPSQSFNRFIVSQMAWTSVFIASCVVLYPRGRATLLVRILWGITLVVCLIGIFEARRRSVLWAGYTPSFLQIEDESVKRFLAGTARAASGIYRVQSKFTTSLGFAEFLALSMPFMIHLLVRSKRWITRIAAAVTIAMMLYCIRATDSRLAVIGALISAGAYVFFWAFLTWRHSPKNLIAIATLSSYPVMFVLAVVSTFTVDAVRIRVWGGGAAQYSTEARKIQYNMGIPKVIQRPWGWGIGSGGQVLGYIDGNGLATIDTFYLSAALEYGIIGLIAFFVMTVGAIYLLARALPYIHDNETELIGPLMIAVINFLIIKSVLSAQENHSFVYILLGMALVLIERVKRVHATGNALEHSPHSS